MPSSNTNKHAFAHHALIGAGTGALSSDEGHGWEGAGWGALGGVAGGLAGDAIAPGIGSLIGALGGGYYGGRIPGPDDPDVPPIDLEEVPAEPPKTASIPYRAGHHAALAKVGIDLSESGALGTALGGVTGYLRAPEDHGFEGMVGGALGGGLAGAGAHIGLSHIGNPAVMSKIDPEQLAEIAGIAGGLGGGVGGQALIHAGHDKQANAFPWGNIATDALAGGAIGGITGAIAAPSGERLENAGYGAVGGAALGGGAGLFTRGLGHAVSRLPSAQISPENLEELSHMARGQALVGGLIGGLGAEPFRNPEKYQPMSPEEDAAEAERLAEGHG